MSRLGKNGCPGTGDEQLMWVGTVVRLPSGRTNEVLGVDHGSVDLLVRPSNPTLWTHTGAFIEIPQWLKICRYDASLVVETPRERIRAARIESGKSVKAVAERMIPKAKKPETAESRPGRVKRRARALKGVEQGTAAPRTAGGFTAIMFAIESSK